MSHVLAVMQHTLADDLRYSIAGQLSHACRSRVQRQRARGEKENSASLRHILKSQYTVTSHGKYLLRALSFCEFLPFSLASPPLGTELWLTDQT